MDNSNLILDIQKGYDERSISELLANTKIALSLGKLKGLEVDRYRTLPSITRRSSSTVVSWFVRSNVKIPLIYLCMIARYLRYNIFAFFIAKNDGEVTNEDFLMANDYCNAHYPEDSADIYIKAFTMQLETDKEIVLRNVEKYYMSSAQIAEHNSRERKTRIMETCQCNLQTYHAWFNRSRKNVKIPLLSLCKLAIEANVDVFELMAP